MISFSSLAPGPPVCPVGLSFPVPGSEPAFSLALRALPPIPRLPPDRAERPEASISPVWALVEPDFEVIIIVPGEVGGLARLDPEGSLAQSPNEVEVVAYEDQSAGVFLQGLDHRVDAGHVQMGCGLVKQKEIGWG